MYQSAVFLHEKLSLLGFRWIDLIEVYRPRPHCSVSYASVSGLYGGDLRLILLGEQVQR